MSRDCSFPNQMKTDKIEKNRLNAHLVPNTISTTYSAVPWYLGGGTDISMSHHKSLSALKQMKKSETVRTQGAFNSQNVLEKWHPGCCNNCGSSSHKTKDCIELPRKKPARKTGIAVAADQTAKHGDSVKSFEKNTEIKEYSEAVVSNQRFHHSNSVPSMEHSRFTMREYDDMPAYLKEGVLSYDPRTHALRQDRFHSIGCSEEEKLSALKDARGRLEAMKKFDLIGESAVLPSELDKAYQEEYPPKKALDSPRSIENVSKPLKELTREKSHVVPNSTKTEVDNSVEEYTPL